MKLMTWRLNCLVILIFLIAGCCHFPYYFSADPTVKSARAVLVSPDTGEAYLGASFERFTLTSQVKCFPNPVIVMASVGPPDQNGIVHFGAFAVRHGKSNEMASAFWWSNKGKLRSYRITAPNSEEISITWINERMVRFQFGKDAKTVRLNEDDGAPFDEL